MKRQPISSKTCCDDFFESGKKIQLDRKSYFDNLFLEKLHLLIHTY